MGKIAFVFNGQGAQFPGMGKDLFEKHPEAFETFCCLDRIRPETTRQCFEAELQELSRTENTQPCLHALNLACARALESEGVKADGAAGFSLGELSALSLAGAIDLEESMELVSSRGKLMQKASDSSESGMVAVLKLSPQEVEELCDEDLYPVNYNTPNQTVVAGRKDRLESFSKKVKENGGKAIVLPVSGAFHSPLMTEASEAFKEELKQREFKACKRPVYSNMTAKPYPENVNLHLQEHMLHAVRWHETIKTMVEDGFDTFVEVGASGVLSRMIKAIVPEVRTFAVYDMESLLKTADEVKSA